MGPKTVLRSELVALTKGDLKVSLAHLIGVPASELSFSTLTYTINASKQSASISNSDAFETFKQVVVREKSLKDLHFFIDQGDVSLSAFSAQLPEERIQWDMPSKAADSDDDDAYEDAKRPTKTSKRATGPDNPFVRDSTPGGSPERF